MATTRKYGTCFFEQYAQITLAALLGSGYKDLVNRDRITQAQRRGFYLEAVRRQIGG